MGCDIHPYVEVRKHGKWQRAPIKVPNDRDYFAFGKLANVRNGLGFAGIDMGDPVRPIAEPRGLPLDTTIRDSESSVEYEQPGYCWLGDHSHSWVLLSELLDVDYNALVTQRGMVSKDSAERFREFGYPPNSWCGDTNQKDWERIEWKQPLYEVAPLLPKLIACMCGQGKPEDVRLVFGFDS
jgi:hypothetical protein